MKKYKHSKEDMFFKQLNYPSALNQPLMICMVKDGFKDLNSYMTYLFETRVKQDGVNLDVLYGITKPIETQIKPVEETKPVEQPKTPSPRVWGVKSVKK